MKYLFMLLAIITSAIQTLAAPQWKAITPGGGGIFTDIVCSESDPNLMYLSSDVASLLRSEDKGTNWVGVSHGLGSQYVQAIALDPDNTNGVYISISDGVYHSADRGDNWTRLGETGANNLSLGRLPGQSHGPGMPSDLAVVRDGTNNVIYVGTGHLNKDTNSTATLWVSRDSGVTFTNRAIPGISGTSPVYSVLSRSVVPNEVWVSTGEGILQSMNYGETWTMKTNGLPHVNARQMQCSRYSTHELTVALESDGTSDSGVYYFDPGTQLWENLTGNLPLTNGTRRIKYRFLDGDRRDFPNTLIVGSGERLLNDGYYMTTDRGTNWTFIGETDNVVPNWYAVPVRGWMLYYNTEGNGEIYIGGDHRMLESTDGGSNFRDIVSTNTGNAAVIWTPISNPSNSASMVALHTWSGAGETDNQVVRKIVVDPHNDNNLFMCCADNVLFRSQDGGESWRLIKFRIGPVWTGDSHSLVFHPDTPDEVYALAAKGYSKNHGEGAIFKSTDGGDSWTTLAGTVNEINGLPGYEMHELVFGPKDANNPRKMFVSLYQKGVYESDDNGDSWALVGLEDAPVRQIVVNPLSDTVLFAGVTGGPDRGVWKFEYQNDTWTGTHHLTNNCWNVQAADDMKYYAATDNGLFRTYDQGTNWTRLDTTITNITAGIPATTNIWAGFTNESDMGSRQAKFQGLAVDTNETHKVYVSQYGHNPGIWRSSNHGNSWTEITRGHNNPRAMWLHIHKDDNTNRWLYSASQGNGVHKVKLRAWE